MVNVHSFKEFIKDGDFPCIGAKAALSHHSITFFECGSLSDSQFDIALSDALAGFAHQHGEAGMFMSLVALFNDTTLYDEETFEHLLWQRLQNIHDHDSTLHEWDASVNSDPESPQFSFSVGGHGFYVVGLHPGASRMARRFQTPALVFNLHHQFEQLRHDGQYDKMSRIIRQREIKVSGTINPMLASFGESSEAIQYSGRQVGTEWKCPFHSHTKHINEK